MSLLICIVFFNKNAATARRAISEIWFDVYVRLSKRKSLLVKGQNSNCRAPEAENLYNIRQMHYTEMYKG